MKNLQSVEISLDASSTEAKLASTKPTNPEVFPDIEEGVSTTSASATSEYFKPDLTSVINQTRMTTAAISGATGAFGVLGQVLDIPAFYGNAILQISRIARQHGYDPTKGEEKEFIKKLLLAGHLPTIKTRQKELANIHNQSGVKTYAAEIGSVIASRGSTISAYKLASRALASRLKFMLPVIGAATNIVSNMRLMEAILDTAVRGYARRKALESNLKTV